MADNSDEIKYKVGVELEEQIPANNNQEELKKSGENYTKSLDDVTKYENQTRDSLDKINARGYNPNASMADTGASTVGKTSSLDRGPGRGLTKDEDKSGDTKKNESASSSDYSKTPTSNGTSGDGNYDSPPPPPNQSNGTTEGDNQVTKDNGVTPAQSVPESAGQTDGQTDNQGGGALPRQNELKKEKKEDNEGDNSDNGANDDGTNKKNPDAKSEEKNPEAPDNIDKSKKDEAPDPSAGNGYGALNKPNKEGNPDGTDAARKNLEHSRRMQEGKRQEEGQKEKKPSSSGSINQESTPSLGTRIKNNLKNLLNGKGNSEGDVSDGSGSKNNSEGGNNPFRTALNKLKSALLKFLAAHPFLVIVIVALLFILLILFIQEIENATKNGNRCTYSLNGIISSGTVKLEGLQVELINCDGTSRNYTVLENVDFERYVVGVTLAEIGYSSDNPEYFKTGIIAARNFALTRNRSMCPSNPDDCFYGYNPNSGKIRMRACEADQVYWDYDKDIYRYGRGAISLYSPEINSGTIWKRALSEETILEIQKIADEVKGEVLIDDSGNVVHTDYINTDQLEWLRMSREGLSYDEILAKHYGGHMSGAKCSSGNIDYGDYVLSSDGHTILHEPLDSFLQSQGTSLEAFNSLIAENVKKNGYGTRAGVVAAAVTLIAELGNNYGVKVPYYWGGGHYDGVVDGALGYWGSTQCHTYANNQSYNYCGLDCSGFVPWAIKNGGFNISQMLASDFQYMSGARRVSLSNSPVLEPGDLLESNSHIVLVVGVEESSGVYICAEAAGNAYGVLFTRRPFNSSGYWGVKMDGFYETHQRSAQ